MKSKAEHVSTTKRLIDNEELSEELYPLSDFFLSAMQSSKSYVSLIENAADLVRSVGRKLDGAHSKGAARIFEFLIEINLDLEALMTNSDITHKLRTKFSPIVSAKTCNPNLTE